MEGSLALGLSYWPSVVVAYIGLRSFLYTYIFLSTGITAKAYPIQVLPFLFNFTATKHPKFSAIHNLLCENSSAYL